MLFKVIKTIENILIEWDVYITYKQTKSHSYSVWWLLYSVNPFRKDFDLLLLLLLESQFLDSLFCFRKDDVVMKIKINCSISILYILSFFGTMHPNMKYSLCKLMFFISTSKIKGKKINPTIARTFELLLLLNIVFFFLSFHWNWSVKNLGSYHCLNFILLSSLLQ